MTINAATVIARLVESEIPHEILSVGPEASIIVSSYGGRVYGPFFGTDVSANWIPDAFLSADAFAELIGSGFWNVGGERVWVGPEIAFMIPQRDDYWGSYTMPPSIDPGVHTIERDGNSIVLRRTATLESFIEPTGTAVVDVEIRVRAAQHPLRHLRGPFAHAATANFAGYTSEVTITQTSALPILAESWNLTQIPAGGIALVSTVPKTQVTDYYEPVGDHGCQPLQTWLRRPACVRPRGVCRRGSRRQHNVPVAEQPERPRGGVLGGAGLRRWAPGRPDPHLQRRR
jgi:hypothetical protein